MTCRTTISDEAVVVFVRTKDNQWEIRKFINAVISMLCISFD